MRINIHRPGIFLALLAMVAAPTSSYAANGQIGFVNIQVIMSQAPQAKAAGERLQQKFSGRRKAIEACSRDIEDIDQTLRREGRSMEKSRRDRLVDRIKKVRRSCDRLKEDFEADFNRSRREELQEFEQQVTRVIDQIAKERDFRLIIGPPAVLYVDERTDLTSEVLDALSRESR